ncbi:hypothetical protein CYMTET_31234 [Cymbomonas tetramitiformis]|uniref:Uncharacterized protein n=1 Tax=Cymbomonas tetramitiformis TaxID=36881 RepID=A0AAE0FHY3_9CHLO|nr:hypothetical protein CYMTET_31234 [Cymbomonas tetramitiformis]
MNYYFEWTVWWRLFSGRHFFTCSQVFGLMHHFEQWAIKFNPRTRVATPSIIQAKLRFMAMFHCRLTDLCMFIRTLRDWMNFELQQQVIQQLGILNLMNPFDLDGRYRFDMARKEDHRCARGVVIALSLSEPGNNVLNEIFNGYRFELPSFWEDHPPNRGLYETTYFTPSTKCARPAVRAKLASQTCLLGTSPADMQMAQKLAEKQKWISPRITFHDATIEERYGLTDEEVIMYTYAQNSRMATQVEQTKAVTKAVAAMTKGVKGKK